ncbi:MAG: TonB-dependent receptor [Deltaproteobacteria bacterium]|nr:TonB-dependent receptor [Deltaproteobacteria bacterium]
MKKNACSPLAALLILILVFFSLPVLSATSDQLIPKEESSQPQSDEDEEEFTRLIQFIDKYTEIATKTKLNVDFVPGMVTVLRGEELKVRGINNVWEAMSLVPGMDISVNNMGLRDVLVRGIGNTILSGNLKIQLNGISMNSALWGKAYPALDIPVEQIDRIEIIRGPGSAVHGEFASTGVINIITLNKGRHISAGIGRYDSYHGSALYSFSDSASEIDFSLNVAASDTDGANVISGPDQLYGMGMGDISNAPGPVNEVRDVSNAIMGLSFKGIHFTGYYLNEGQGDYYGFLGSLPPPHSSTTFRFKNYGGQIKQEIHITGDFLFEYNLGFFQHRFSSALTFQQPPGFAGIYAEGMAAAPFYQEDRMDAGFDFTYAGWNKHTIKFGAAYANTEIHSAWHDTNYTPSTGAPLSPVSRFTGSENWIEEGMDRELINMTIQDEYKLNDEVSITGGLRFDHYDDVGSEVSPRIAAVWRITQNHIIKAQYARAFCPPTFNQLYSKNNPYLVGNPAIEPETIDTLEASYLYSDEFTMGRLTYFYSDLDNLISSGGGTYSNTGSTRISGAELEIEHKLFERFKLDSNISYSHSRNNITGGSIPEVAEWLGDLGIIFESGRDMAFNLQYSYIGKRNRAVTDTRPKLKGYHTIDATVSLYNFLTPGLTLRGGMKNILNEDIYYAAPEYLYVNDYPRPGREWWIKISYDF